MREPEPVVVPPRVHLTVSADTAYDKDTQLTWQRRVESARYTFDEARKHCARLKLGAFSTGWRLPTMDELRTIVDNNAGPPSADRVAFPKTPSEWFWTSSLYDNDEGEAWAVSFIDGETSMGSVLGSYVVRCVH